ncbi:hypothetical protein SAMN05421848_2463 [Kushneria avicenniae]|uniref:Spore coat protein U (SCPU) domain-containing protein n=1 Tax=Kushneria avicenniae TaxID=402385 RepID=A0A1I1LSK6_9GAMM|nr:hypothetical protein [Kushneria avicenniae]SFC72440.1 hypothetical protein SAMN05421848_2463 [Kushneria avicenniae]
MPLASLSDCLRRTVTFMGALVLSGLAQASGGQFQSTMTVRAGCSVMDMSATAPGLDYLCSPNVGDFRLSLDAGRHGEGLQRYLSDGHTRTPYRLQVHSGQGERRNADRVLSISLPDTATTLMLQTFNTPVAALAPATGTDTVLATFEY